MPSPTDLSIVIPVYNEEENLPPLWQEIREALVQTGLVYEVIFVDDGSVDRSAEIVAATGRILQVGHVFRFHPVTGALRERLASGQVGAIRYLTGRFAGFKRPRADVGVTMTDAIHYFDLFAYLLGEAPVGVTATLADHLGRGMDDCSFATVEYGRVPAFIEAGYFAPGTYRDCVIVGEQATLAADFGTSEVRVHVNQHVKGDGGWQAREGGVESVKASGKEPLSHELGLFLDAITHRSLSAVDVEAGLTALRVVEAAQRSSALGRRVAFSEID